MTPNPTDGRTRVQADSPPTAELSADVTNPTFGAVPAGGVPGFPFLAPPERPDEIGRLGDYRVLKKLGEGGMGFVFANKNAPNLHSLNLHSPELTDAMAADLVKCQNLGVLHPEYPNVTGRVFEVLNGGKVKTMNLIGCRIADADLPRLERRPELIELGLGATPVTDAGLKAVGRLTHLTTLLIHDCPNVTDAGVAHLGGLKNLTYLDMNWSAADGSRLTTATFATAGKLTALKQLHARFGPAADADLKHLVGLQDLEELHFNPAALTDAGLDVLAKLKALKRLGSLKGSKVTAAGVKAFRAAGPACKVETDFDTTADR